MEIPLKDIEALPIVVRGNAIDTVIHIVSGPLDEPSNLSMHVIYDTYSGLVYSKTFSPLVTFCPGVTAAYNIDDWLPPRFVLNEASPIARALIISTLYKLEECLSRFIVNLYSPYHRVKEDFLCELSQQKTFTTDECIKIFVPKILELFGSVKSDNEESMRNITRVSKMIENIFTIKILSETSNAYHLASDMETKFTGINTINGRIVEKVIQKAINEYFDNFTWPPIEKQQH